MSKSKPTYQELEKRLAAAESIVKVLKNHEVDAVVGEEKIAVLLLREVEETLQTQRRRISCHVRASRHRHGPGRYSRFPLHQSQPEVLRDCGVFGGRTANQDLHWPHSSCRIAGAT